MRCRSRKSAWRFCRPWTPSTRRCRQISGALVDRPLALDNAIDLEAARIKRIDSPLAGRASVLLVPDLEAGKARRGGFEGEAGIHLNWS